MSISVILAHPGKKSFNHAIARTALEVLEHGGREAVFHDLCAEGFDPLLRIEEFPKGAPLTGEVARHCEELRRADGIIIVHPNWWGQPPAILKGWVDRVIRPGVAYEFLEGDSGEGVPVGLLKGKKAIVFNTSNTPAQREERVFGDPLELLWKHCIFGLCGVEEVHRRMFSVVVDSGEEERKAWLQEVRDTVGRIFPGTGNRESGGA